MNYIEMLHEENMAHIRNLTALALADLDSRADAVLDDIRLAHQQSMDDLEWNLLHSQLELIDMKNHRSEQDALDVQNEEQNQFADLIAPYMCVEDWFEGLSTEERSVWYERFEAYCDNPDSDYNTDDLLSSEVMRLLLRRCLVS